MDTRTANLITDLRVQAREMGDHDAYQLLGHVMDDMHLWEGGRLAMYELLEFRAMIAHVSKDVRHAFDSTGMDYIVVDFVIGERMSDITWSVRAGGPRDGLSVRRGRTMSELRLHLWTMWFRAWRDATPAPVGR